MLAFSLGSAALGFIVAAVIATVLWWLYLRPPSEPPAEGGELPAWFSWLADAPMFLDSSLVSSFFDAVLRPAYRTTSVELSEQRTASSTVKNAYGLKASQLIPGLELSAGSEVSTSESVTRGSSRKIEPIHNQPRELVSLALHYVKTYPDRAEGAVVSTASSESRIWEELDDPDDKPWSPPDLARINSRPRMLAFLDFPRGTKFIPMAVETDKGVTPVYESLVEELEGPASGPCPKYPDDPSDPRFGEAINEYWQWFNDNWIATAALVALEKAVAGPAKPRWVNYRVPVQDSLTLHLSVVGHEAYDTGIFAYNLIKRGWRHGVRIVGTVRAEPGLNVLAIYDK